MSSGDIVDRGRRVIRLEREALAGLEERLGDAFSRAVTLLTEATGRVIVTGVGKSGLIGRKIAATLTSTGTLANFLHPVDSIHGDLGIVGRENVAILISKSGESDELLALLAHLKGFGVRTIAITGNPESALGRNCDVALDASVREEACPHDLAPTTSTTAALVLGDALAVALLQEKGFEREDFARIHPGGALGRKLVVRIEEIMLRQKLPVLKDSDTMREAIVMIAERRGIAVVTDGAGHVEGVLTAGDLSRLIERRANETILSIPVRTVMTRSPKLAKTGELASAVAYRLEQAGIMAMPVVDERNALVGVVHLHDLLARESRLMRRIASWTLLVVAIAIAACRDTKQPPVVGGPSMADSADQVLFGVQYVLTTRGIQRGELKADTAYVLDDQNRFDLRKAHVTFTTELGAPQGTMDGNRGVYNLRTQLLEGWGDVIVKLVDGRTLTSPHVTYNQVTHLISSDTSYVLTRGNRHPTWHRVHVRSGVRGLQVPQVLRRRFLGPGARKVNLRRVASFALALSCMAGVSGRAQQPAAGANRNSRDARWSPNRPLAFRPTRSPAADR